ncbi:MAG TPA: hypothetical protein VFA04_13120 [Bryobacteraceae bacterium]|nr:hypothetical protein [Bryobacteraceae bacterium]
MYRIAYASYSLLLGLAALGGCSSQPGKEASKPATAPDKIQGKALVADWESTPADAALNAGGPTVYLVDGLRRYRLFFNKAIPVEKDKQYIAEGVYAQKAIDDFGDPDKGRNGYPLASSCDRVVRTAWPGLAFDLADADSSALRARVKRYPARAVFLVRRLTPVTAGSESKKEADEGDIPEVTVAAEKQRPLLLEGPTVQPAPLWEPSGGIVNCKVVINKEGRISELATGAQLCEAVPWSEFRYQPPVKAGKPVTVKTEVEVRFQPRT